LTGDVSSGQAPGLDEPVFATLSRGADNQLWYPVSWGAAMHALIDAGHHYILNGDGTEELYDAAADPGETRNLAGDPAAQETLERLRRAMRERVPDGPAFLGPGVHPTPPPPGG
jgi:hypothetical protein